MANPNANISDIVATTIAARSKYIADNVTKNIPILSKLNSAVRVHTFYCGAVVVSASTF